MNPLDLRLYGLLDPARSGGRPLRELAARAVSGGATLIQLRDKQATARRLAEEARTLRQVLGETGVPLIVNDSVEAALAAEADGVHLGQDDLDPRDARRLLGPRALIGVSVKNESEARAAPLDAVDYAAVGGVFETLSKDNPDPPIGIDGLAGLIAVLRQRRAGLPVCAIAGMTAARAPTVIGAGADGIAVISALSLAEDVTAAAGDLRAAVDAALTQRTAP